MIRKRLRIVRSAIIPLLAMGLLLGSCGGEKERPESPIFVLGMDALDWQVLGPLLERGLLPNFETLIRESTRGDIMTLVPLTQSPAIWTTIGTGRFPETHGVSGFLKAGAEGTPTMRSDRRVKAVWNILGSAGMEVGVVGWLVTWPCEAVNGFMVSDYLQYNFDDVSHYSGQTYPPELLDRVSPLVIRRKDVPLDSLRWAVKLSPDLSELSDGSVREGLETLRWIYAADETFIRIGLELWREHHPGFFTVYLRGPDAICHRFWGQRPPEGGEYRSVFAPTVDAYYRYMDRVLGRLLAEIDDSVSLIVLSDHGFKGATVLDDGTLVLGVGAHRELGVILARGPHFRRGAVVEGAAVEDITPTILYLAGLPLARDMDGEPLWGLFTPEFREKNPPRFIDTYETEEHRAQPAPEGSPVDDMLIERLKSLGYL